MHMGWEIDSSGLEAKRQAKNVYNQAKNKGKNNKDMKAAQKNAEKISRIPLIFDKNVIASLKGQKLQDQLDACWCSPPCIGKGCEGCSWQGKAINHAIYQYESDKWSPIGFEDGETESFQADDNEEQNEEK